MPGGAPGTECDPRRLGEGCAARGEPLDELPVVFQWNKRDLADAVPTGRLGAALNPGSAWAGESVAASSAGVLEALQQAAKLALRGLEALDE